MSAPKILTLSGWGQPENALNTVLKHADSFAYTKFKNAEAAVMELNNTLHGYDVIIGWSLGAQLIMRSMHSGNYKGKKIILIAPPVRFVSHNPGELGMGATTFSHFKKGYDADSLRCLKKAAALIAYRDSHEEHILTRIAQQDVYALNRLSWGDWLEELEHYHWQKPLNVPDCIHLVHGAKDNVVDAAQSLYLQELLPQATLHLWADAGHAPHWHDENAFRKLVEESW